MKRTLKPLIIVVVLLLTGLQTVQAQSGRQVWAFYMGWWAGGQSWDWQADVLSDYPAIGKYDSRDGGVVGTQIAQAQGTGIDAFIVSWFGVRDGVTTTPALNNMLDRAAERGFRIGAAYDAFNPAFTPDRGALIESLNYLVNDRANHPAYLRYNGKPVIFFAFQNNLGYSNAVWNEIRNTVDPNRNTIWIAEGLNGCCIYGGAMDGMYAFNIAWANGSQARYQTETARMRNAGGNLYIPTVHPAWDESRIAARDNRPNPTSPRDRAGGAFLANSFRGATGSGASVVLIGTWNEFIENSHIEPSQNFGTQAIDTLRPLIAAWKGGAALPASSVTAPAAPAGSAVGLMVTSARPINVRPAPNTGNEPIGNVSPGTAYTITEELGGWLKIDYNGRTGYVARSVVIITSP